MSGRLDRSERRGADFSVWEKEPAYKEAFLWIRACLARHAILHHVDDEAAARLETSGRPLEWSVGGQFC